MLIILVVWPLLTPAVLVYLQTWVSLNFPPPLTFLWASGSFPPVQDSFDRSFIYIMTTGCLYLWALVIMWLSVIIKQLSPLMDAVFPFANEWETGSLFPSLSASLLSPSQVSSSLWVSLLVCLPGSHSVGCTFGCSTCFSVNRWGNTMLSSQQWPKKPISYVHFGDFIKFL